MKQFSTDHNNICIDFSKFPFCFKCVKYKDFINKLKDTNQFFKYFKRIFETEIPMYTQYSFDNIVKMTNKHSHPIRKNTDDYNKIINIIKELLKSYKEENYNNQYFENFLRNNINDYNLWQLGVSSSLRIFGIRESNNFAVLFIDYHHLIYPDKNYNHYNYDLYDFCPITNGGSYE